MKVNANFIKALVNVLENSCGFYNISVADESCNRWTITFEMFDTKTEIYISPDTCIIGAYDMENNYKWFSTYACHGNLEKIISRDRFFFMLSDTLRTIRTEMDSINDKIYEEKYANAEAENAV